MARKPGPAVHGLVVGADPAVVRRLQAFLKRRALPLQLHAVTRGAAALAFLGQEGRYAKAPRPQVIFLDVQLPARERLQLLAAIDIDPAWRAIPVVLFNGAEAPHEHLLAAGLTAAYLTHALGREQYLELLAKLPRRR